MGMWLSGFPVRRRIAGSYHPTVDPAFRPDGVPVRQDLLGHDLVLDELAIPASVA
jgi:hypothetical protein